MNNLCFYEYAKTFGTYQKHPMFGGIGLFSNNAMYLLITGKNIYLRGGGKLDKELACLGCSRYRHVKKQGTVIVNYYNITELYNGGYTGLASLVRRSIFGSIEDRKQCFLNKRKRLRDLPNMRLTLERMVIKSGVKDVDSFVNLGAVRVYHKVKLHYGKKVDYRLLWKFSGAISGVHWMLIDAKTKKELKRTYDSL
ncbi:TfoX/Sxy family DNA transformation protein [Vibrio sp. TH_r3]|uniref:TfoX/Sxy family DNA transformation protein n=1 Tax=Vibrio sp. TH_r3 TaxID=3082084 RepID=UPI0029542F4C|nr:TfoX/Sxy family DNA transformation protein [Vibrio sp. TH_r3]MDV7104285.1 TfoX/Sxy family DNA transformation protein [Vibrio sp. TH_r3]